MSESDREPGEQVNIPLEVGHDAGKLCFLAEKRRAEQERRAGA